MKERNECFKILKKFRRVLTKQQINTFKGQILVGDYIGFKKGLYNILKEQR